MLCGGLALAAVHEVFAEGHQGAAATGFLAGIAGRISSRKPLVWVRQDFAELESGALSPSGLVELGLDPRLLVTVRAADVESALRTTADALACDALGAVVLETFGEARQLDLVASRKLTLAAQSSGVTALLLRVGGEPCAFDRGDALDRARGAFAAVCALECMGRAGVRRATRFATVMARSGGGSWNGNVMSASSANRRRILSLWLPHLPIDRIRRQSIAFSSEVGTGSRKENASNKIASRDAGQGNFPSVVVAKDHNAMLLYAIDEAAVRAGLSIGLPLANARAICPELTVYDADEAADRKTLEDIADWCDRFTPLVALDPPHGLFLDITGCAHLFGGEAALLRQLTGALTRQGFAVSAAIAAHLDLRAHADALRIRQNRRRWRGG